MLPFIVTNTCKARLSPGLVVGELNSSTSLN